MGNSDEHCVVTDRRAHLSGMNEHVIDVAYHDNLSCCIRTDVPVEQQTCTTAAASGHLPCLLRSIDRGFRLNANATAAAARGGHLLCLKLLVLRECRISRTAFLEAALNGHLLCLQYLCETQDFAYRDAQDIGVLAAQGGSIRCLCYLVDHGYRVDEMCYVAAASAGHLCCLEYLHKQKCPWDSNTMFVAARGGSIACLCYAYAHHCPWWELDSEIDHLDTSSTECLLFIEKYCPLLNCDILTARTSELLYTLRSRRIAGIWVMSKYSVPAAVQQSILQYAGVLCQGYCAKRANEEMEFDKFTT